jgi:hypothetical protein
MNEQPFTVALPVIADAKLPINYEAARKAIQECVRIDECLDWADRAAALASYAKQAEDEQLLKHSQRIKARAISRCSELLREHQAAPGARTDQPRGDAPPGPGLRRPPTRECLAISSRLRCVSGTSRRTTSSVRSRVTIRRRSPSLRGKERGSDGSTRYLAARTLMISRSRPRLSAL